MKRRAKLSLKRSNQKLKKPHVIDCSLESHDYLNKSCKSSHTVSGFVASLSTPSCQETAEVRKVGDIGEASGPELAPIDHPNVRDNTFPEEATHDCEVSSLDNPTDSMSCESTDVSLGSGHQIELERYVEECGDTDDAILSSGVSCNSKEEFNSEDVDCITGPTPKIDLCTHYCDDHSNPALYALSSDDMAQFEDFDVPRTQRTHSNPSIKRQTSLLSFMSKTSRSNSTTPSMNSDCSNSKQQTAGISLANSSIPTGIGKVTNRVNGQAGTGSQVSKSSEGNGTKRTCPFYKRIPGTLYNG